MANELTNRFNNWMKQDDFFGNLGRSFFDFDNSVNRALKTDVKETDEAYDVRIDVPGIDKKNIAVEYHDGLLSVSAKRDSFSDESDDKGNVIASERSYGRFARQYSLPNVDKDGIKAKCEDGVLKLTLPKLAAEKTTGNHIEIE
ncbi:Hsp20/alpha crystallin family protein [Liquorilactobacillus capillatus]|uniref:Heat shock protein Hsp20 n=1 Tax=Liquorilactobacillus capillatus DSM 19910 TaxID=1423731 RepID=A0A0R1ME51_9LACO|nr:Hsp20/alpha crystallin family protein [Liquorilactobacillus capillatus]KRL02483.1 heat shock protein Hsp20 [Liquorilactobacillus capillatus DSM 19910]